MHVDHDSLALLALGESDPPAQAHVRECAECQAEVDSLARVAALMVATGPVIPVPPPSHVWARIEAAVTDADADGAATPRVPGEPASPTTRDHGVPASPTIRDDLGRRPQEHASGASGLRARRVGAGPLLAAAASGAVLALAGNALLSGDPDVPDQRVVASAELAALDDTVVPATAEVVERDGQRVLHLDTADVPSVDGGYLEVWLLRPDASGMVTIGLLESQEQDFLLPEGLSTEEFGVVDVSVEHYDGDPTHSGDSLWRGPLATG